MGDGSIFLKTSAPPSLKVHKIENFFDSEFDWPIIGGGTIFPRSPRTTQNEKNF